VILYTQFSKFFFLGSTNVNQPKSIKKGDAQVDVWSHSSDGFSQWKDAWYDSKFIHIGFLGSTIGNYILDE
jgi:hypothetical protein